MDWDYPSLWWRGPGRKALVLGRNDYVTIRGKEGRRGRNGWVGTLPFIVSM
jgi:hypothetical protein